MRPRSLRELQAFRKLELLPRQDISDVATDLLSKGEESEPIMLMAGLGHDPNPFEADELLEDALQEAGFDALSEMEATTLVAQRVASAIIDGSMSAHEGAGWIWNELRLFDHPDVLIEFKILADELEDYPVESERSRDKIEEEIKLIAAELLQLKAHPARPPERAENGR